jgi:hypothetical protein
MQHSHEGTALLRFHGNAFNIFYAVVRDRCTSTVQMDCIVAFIWQQSVRGSATMLHYVYCCLSSSGSCPQVLPYKANNQAMCFVYHNIFKLLLLI